MKVIYILLAESAGERDEKKVGYIQMCDFLESLGHEGQKIVDTLIKANALFLVKGLYIGNDREIDELKPMLIANNPIEQLAIDRYVHELKHSVKKFKVKSQYDHIVDKYQLKHFQGAHNNNSNPSN